MINTANKEDVKYIYSLIQQLENYPLDYDTFYIKYNNILDNDHWFIFKYEEDGKIKGCITVVLKNYLHHNHTTAEIVELIVDENYRNQSIGHALISYVEDTLKNRVEEIELSTSLWRKDAHRFYLREGFDNNHYTFIKKLDDSNK